MEVSVEDVVGVPPLPAQVSSEDASAIAADVRCLIISARRLLAGGGLAAGPRDVRLELSLGTAQMCEWHGRCISGVVVPCVLPAPPSAPPIAAAIATMQLADECGALVEGVRACGR